LFVKNAIFLYIFYIHISNNSFSLSLSSNRVPHTLINFIPHSPNKTKRKNMTWQHSNREKKKTPVEAWTLVSEFYEICLLWVYRRGGRFYTNLEIPLSRTTLFFFEKWLKAKQNPSSGMANSLNNSSAIMNIVGLKWFRASIKSIDDLKSIRFKWVDEFEKKLRYIAKYLMIYLPTLFHEFLSNEWPY
jgi:hypothetical protein